jgi:hypothetical protein
METEPESPARTPSPTERRIPMKLSDTQLVLLSAASQREDGAVVLAPNLKGGAASKVVGKLLRDGKKSRPPRRCRRGAVTMTRGRGRCALANEALRPSELTVARHRRPRKSSPPSRGPLTHPKCLDARVALESIRGTKLRTSRRRPITADQSRPGCSRCCSVRRAQPLRPS